MTFHPDPSPAVRDPSPSLEEAFRLARAAAHSRRLDIATQAALDALVDFARAARSRIRELDAELTGACERIAALEASRRRESVRNGL